MLFAGDRGGGCGFRGGRGRGGRGWPRGGGYYNGHRGGTFHSLDNEL